MTSSGRQSKGARGGGKQIQYKMLTKSVKRSAVKKFYQQLSCRLQAGRGRVVGGHEGRGAVVAWRGATLDL